MGTGIAYGASAGGEMLFGNIVAGETKLGGVPKYLSALPRNGAATGITSVAMAYPAIGDTAQFVLAGYMGPLNITITITANGFSSDNSGGTYFAVM